MSYDYTVEFLLIVNNQGESPRFFRVHTRCARLDSDGRLHVTHDRDCECREVTE